MELNNVDIKIKVFGLGGGGGNAIDNMIINDVQGVDFAIANTDIQAMNRSCCKEKILLGSKTTKGMGAGADPEVGRKACVESEAEIAEAMKGYDMVFLAAGLGGGTGTAACSCFAEIARQLGILSVAIVTKPFSFEGKKREKYAEEGLSQLLKAADATVVVSNNNLKALIGRRPLSEAFKVADDTLRSGVQAITDLINGSALINLDFADVCATLRDQGHAVLGIGLSKNDSENPASDAARAAVTPMLLENSIKGAKQAIINITGGLQMSLFDAEEAVQVIREATGNDIDTIFGVAINEKMENRVMVTVIATGFEQIEKNVCKSDKKEKKMLERTSQPTYNRTTTRAEKAHSVVNTREESSGIDVLTTSTRAAMEERDRERERERAERAARMENRFQREEIKVETISDEDDNPLSFINSLRNRFEKDSSKENYSYNNKPGFFSNRK